MLHPANKEYMGPKTHSDIERRSYCYLLFNFCFHLIFHLFSFTVLVSDLQLPCNGALHITSSLTKPNTEPLHTFVTVIRHQSIY
jgi:hypothetical protein